MKKTKGLLPLDKLLAFAAAGVFTGIISYFFYNTITKDKSDILFVILPLITGLLAFTISSLVLVYLLYKKTAQYADELRKQISRDNLTELYNRRYLDPFLERELDTARRENRKVSVIMVDVDHFKEINDTYGHVAGDHVLSIFAQTIMKCIRKTDIIARYGGDEFVVVLPNTDTETAKAVAERIREDVANTYIPPVDGVHISRIQCSVGISTYPVHCSNKYSLIKTSDLALYMAKRSGRNCTRVYQAESSPPLYQ